MKILYITTIGGTMNFFKTFIKALVTEGHTVDIACNDSKSKVPDFFYELGCKAHSIQVSRSPLNKGNIKAISQIKKLVKDNKYDIVHCHTPIAAMCTRLACRKVRKSGTKVFYTAHGFHFYKGAPKLNWMIYYPIEKFCSHFTDKLLTINSEDYELAKTKFKAKEISYVPGVGVDLSKFENVSVDKAAKKREIGVPVDAKLLLSVGELNENKNHQIIIKALAKLNDTNIHYAIAGIGDKKEHLLELAKELGVEKQVHLLGFRKDIPELNYASDVFCFPSYREGLGLSSIEAMSCGLPIVTSNVHGINDYSQDGVTGYKCAPTDIDGFAKAIRDLIDNSELSAKMGEYNKKYAKKYEMAVIIQMMMGVYGIE